MEKKYKQYLSSGIKATLFGSEPFGETTLLRPLTRDYLQNKRNNQKKTYEPSDFVAIAEGRIVFESNLSKIINRVLICDTDFLERKTHSQACYLGSCSRLLNEFATENAYDLYFLTYIDRIWRAHNLQDKPNGRQNRFDTFQKVILENNKTYFA